MLTITLCGNTNSGVVYEAIVMKARRPPAVLMLSSHVQDNFQAVKRGMNAMLLLNGWQKRYTACAQIHISLAA